MMLPARGALQVGENRNNRPGVCNLGRLTKWVERRWSTVYFCLGSLVWLAGQRGPGLRDSRLAFSVERGSLGSRIDGKSKKNNKIK